jgi:hypothetical protein
MALRELVRRRRLDELKDLLGRSTSTSICRRPAASPPKPPVIIVDTPIWIACHVSCAPKPTSSGAAGCRRGGACR